MVPFMNNTARASAAIAAAWLCAAQAIWDQANGQPAATIMATGRGRAPARAMTEAQLRLMAKRAAMVEAYKNLAMAIGQGRSSVEGGTGSESVSGFLKGVRLKETRYYADGDVEVDVEMEVGPPGCQASPRSRLPAIEKDLVSVEKGSGVIGEAEWREIFGAEGVPSP